MMPPSAMGALAQRVARSQDDALAGSPLMQSTRARTLAYAPRPRKREAWVLAAYAMAGAAAAAGVLFLMRERPLRVESQTAADLAFSDGSHVFPSPAGDVRINAIHVHGANIELARGGLRASIVHKDKTDWLFNAGPFRVAIVGTKFDLAWDPPSEALTVTVDEGEVRVSGCSIPGMAVSTGQQATLRCNEGQSETAVAPVVSAAPPASVMVAQSAAPPLVAVAPEPEQPSLAPSATTPAPSQDGGAPDWRTLASMGRLRDAYAAAESAGFDVECEKASGRDLLQLADAALLAGRMDRATAALMAARRRFPSSPHAAAAAYRLGRMAFDQRGALGDARNWFQVYLQEAPSGGLAREAAGRLIEIDLRTGNVPGARARAEQYLRQYPDGPHAELAKKILAQR